MVKLSLLWVELTRSVREAELPTVFGDYFAIRIYHDTEPLETALGQVAVPPDVICFHFDYPDRAGLQLVQQTKLRVPNIPMLMVTLQHSEALAIWAFRTRLWDYLVKPIARSEVERCASELQQLRELRTSQPRRRIATPKRALPSDTAATPRTPASRLAPAIYYVEKNFREKIQSEDVARLCAMSPFHFSRSFKEAYGIGFREYLVRYRLREACRLLKNPRASITDVCFAVGFNDHSYFTRMFKRYFGVLPSNAVGARMTLDAEVLALPPAAVFGR